MSAGHYENFPLASVLLPAPLRHPVSIIYRFARSADDLADDGDVPAAERSAQLEVYRQELGRLEAERDVFRHRLVLNAFDWAVLPLRAL